MLKVKDLCAFYEQTKGSSKRVSTFIKKEAANLLKCGADPAKLASGLGISESDLKKWTRDHIGKTTAHIHWSSDVIRAPEPKLPNNEILVQIGLVSIKVSREEAAGLFAVLTEMRSN